MTAGLGYLDMSPQVDPTVFIGDCTEHYWSRWSAVLDTSEGGHKLQVRECVHCRFVETRVFKVNGWIAQTRNLSVSLLNQALEVMRKEREDANPLRHRGSPPPPIK